MIRVKKMPAHLHPYAVFQQNSECGVVYTAIKSDFVDTKSTNDGVTDIKSRIKCPSCGWVISIEEALEKPTNWFVPFRYRLPIIGKILVKRRDKKRIPEVKLLKA